MRKVSPEGRVFLRSHGNRRAPGLEQGLPLRACHTLLLVVSLNIKQNSHGFLAARLTSGKPTQGYRGDLSSVKHRLQGGGCLATGMVGGNEGGAAVPGFASAKILTPSASLGVQAAKCFPHIGALPGSEVEQKAVGPGRECRPHGEDLQLVSATRTPGNRQGPVLSPARH